MQFPVKPGRCPALSEWIPGEHGPTGPIEDLAGVRIKANGQTLAWRRDDVNIYELHIDVPQGVSTLDVSIDFISPLKPAGSRPAARPLTARFTQLESVSALSERNSTDQLQYQANLKSHRMALWNRAAD